MNMAKGPSMPQLGDAGPALAKNISGPNLSIGKIVSIPIRLVTNPLEGLRSLSNLATGGSNPLDKVLKVTGQFTSLLKGNPKILLEEAMGGAGGGSGGLVGGISAKAGDALGTLTQKGIEAGGNLAGKGAGAAGDALAKITGKAIAAIPIPVVAQAVGVGITASGPVINQAAQVAGKVAGKTLGQVAKQAIKTAVRTAVNLTKTAVQKGIKLAVKRGPCKMVGKRTVQLRGQKPSIISPTAITKAVTAKMRQLQRQLQNHPLKKTGQKTVRIGKGVGGFAGRAVGSITRAGQGAAKAMISASEASKAIGTGRPEQAIPRIREVGSSAKGGLKSMAAPGQEALGQAWKRRGMLQKPFGLKVSTTIPKGAGPAVEGMGRQAAAPGKVAQAVRAVKSLSSTISTPFKWPGAKVQAMKNTPVGQTITKGFRVASKPVHWTKAAAGTAGHLARVPAELAKASNQLASSSQALGKGDASAALDQAHAASSHLASAPGHAQAAAKRLVPPSPNPDPSQPPPQGDPNVHRA